MATKTAKAGAASATQPPAPGATLQALKRAREAAARPSRQRAQARTTVREERQEVAQVRERAARPDRVKVQAIKTGFYDLKRRRVGDVFTLRVPTEFSRKWMVRVDAATPERLSTGADELRREHDRILGARNDQGLATNDRDDDAPGVGQGVENPLDAD